MTTRTKYQGITLLQTKRKNHINHAIYNIYNIILTEIDSDFINRKEIYISFLLYSRIVNLKFFLFIVLLTEQILSFFV